MSTFFPYKPTRSTTALAFSLLAALIVTALVSWPALNGPFLFDDFPNLEHLATLDGRLDWASLVNYASSYEGQPGRPLSMLSFVVNDFDWPSSPWSFKYTNLLLHLLIGVLIFGLGRTLARLRTTTPARADLVALLTTAAWLLHPMQLSTSMLVVQRMTQLSALFAVAGIWGYTALARRAQSPTDSLVAIAVLGASTILATLSKETGALIPLLAVVVNSTLMRERMQLLQPTSRRVLQWGAALPVLALAAVILGKLDISSGYAHRNFTVGERALSETRALCEYVFNIVLPNLRGGGIYHDDFAISHNLLSPWTTLPAAFLVAGMLCLALFEYRRWPVFAFAILWFLAGHALESTIVPLELYFEHRNYLPMVGILFSLAFWVVQAASHWKKLVPILAGLWLAYAAWLTSVQAPIWGNRDALVMVWALEHPMSPRAIQEKSAYYYRRGQNQEAAATLLDAYARGVRGSDFPAQVLLLACTTHDVALAERARKIVPSSLRHGELTRALPVTMSKFRREVQSQQCPKVLTEDGWLSLTALLLSNPNYANGTAAAYLHVERAYLFESRRDLNATMLEFQKAWDANQNPEVAQLMAATLASAGLYDSAEVWATHALDHRTGGIRGWFSRDEVKSAQILEALQVARPKQPKDGSAQ